MEPAPSVGTTRRELIGGALGATGGAGLALWFPAMAAADAPTPTDGELLATALGYEELAILSYERVLELPVLSASEQQLMRLLVHQDRQHAAALRRELVALGQSLPAAPSGDGDVDSALSAHGMSGSLAGVRTLKQALQLLLDVEALCEGAYFSAVQDLTATGPMVLAAQALASEAQHSTLLTELLYPGKIDDAVPAWYVAGVR